jgi:cyclic pyranopterin phosphate synthase
MAAKRCPDLIPMCHPLPLTKCKVEIADRDQGEKGRELRVACTVHTNAPTGVEMEALTGASVAALTLFDMLKGARGKGKEEGKGGGGAGGGENASPSPHRNPAGLDMVIESIRVVEKTGGKSGDYRAGRLQ